MFGIGEHRPADEGHDGENQRHRSEVGGKLLGRGGSSRLEAFDSLQAKGRRGGGRVFGLQGLGRLARGPGIQTEARHALPMPAAADEAGEPGQVLGQRSHDGDCSMRLCCGSPGAAAFVAVRCGCNALPGVRRGRWTVGAEHKGDGQKGAAGPQAFGKDIEHGYRVVSAPVPNHLLESSTLPAVGNRVSEYQDQLVASRSGNLWRRMGRCPPAGGHCRGSACFGAG